MALIDPSLAPPRAATQQPAWGPVEFEAQLRARAGAYHIHHPFNRMLNEGRATREQVRGWVANRFYYQIAIPIKDAAVLSNCPDREVRRGSPGYGRDLVGRDGMLSRGRAFGWPPSFPSAMRATADQLDESGDDRDAHRVGLTNDSGAPELVLTPSR